MNNNDLNFLNDPNKSDYDRIRDNEIPMDPINKYNV